MIVVPYTFQCKELLFVLGRMLPPPDLSEQGTTHRAAAELANTISRNVIIVDDREVLVELDEPVEALAIARELELRVERCIAAPLALELVREAGEPAQAAWNWLYKRLGSIRADAPSIVKLPGLQREELPPDVDQIPDGSGVYLWLVGNLLDRADRVMFVDRDQTIGRAGDIVVDDPSVARVHAAIVRMHGTWAIEDRNSPSGVYVDERQCSARCLVPGMTIRMGSLRTVVLSVR